MGNVIIPFLIEPIQIVVFKWERVRTSKSIGKAIEPIQIVVFKYLWNYDLFFSIIIEPIQIVVFKWERVRTNKSIGKDWTYTDCCI